MSKLRNPANLAITIGVAPVLALLIATILRYSDSGKYDFASAYHIPTYLFLSLIVAMLREQEGRLHPAPLLKAPL